MCVEHYRFEVILFCSDPPNELSRFSRRINASQDFFKMRLDRVVAKASPRFERGSVLYPNAATARFKHAFGSKCLDHAARIAAADTQHCRELLVGQRQQISVGTFHRRDDPFCRTLLNRMKSIACGGLKNLRQQALGIAS